MNLTEQDLYDAVTIIRSNRKTCTIQIKPDASIILRVPNRMSRRQILNLLREKQDWIVSHTEKIALQKEALKDQPIFTSSELRQLAEQMKHILPSRLEFYARQLGVTYHRVTIRSQKTRWGSCSSEGNLNFNCLLMLAPSEILDYVIVHELCHRLEMNHSKAFWNHVESVLPDYRIRKKWLKEHGGSLMMRLG